MHVTSRWVTCLTIALLLCAGCIGIPKGSHHPTWSRPQADVSRPELTFRLSYLGSWNTEAGSDDLNRYDVRLSQAVTQFSQLFRESGCLSSVGYEPARMADVHFDLRLRKEVPSEQEWLLKFIACSMTFGFFPYWTEDNLTVTQDVFLHQRYIATFTHTRSLNTVFWLPIMPAWLLGCSAEAMQKRLSRQFAEECIAAWQTQAATPVSAPAQ